MRRLVWAAMGLVAATGLTKAQDLAAGEQSFRKCLPCHSVGEGARHKIGPVLNGLDGRKSGTIEGYNYSEANKKPGTKMAFAGIRNEKEIADLWAYLNQFKADGSKK
jgi:cytochrome c